MTSPEQIWTNGVPLAGHLAEVLTIGWGEPPEFYTRCSCGWTGLRVVTDPRGATNDAVTGNRTDAHIQVLHHIDYDPDADARHALTEYDDAVHQFRREATEPPNQTAVLERLKNTLARAAAELADSAERRRVWTSTSMPRLSEETSS
jgi:hypothetical protein